MSEKKMGDPEQRSKRRLRIRSKIAKDLKTPKYRQRVKEDAKKVDVKGMSHAELVRRIQEEHWEDDD